MDIRNNVREFYGQVASGESQSCCAPACCGTSPVEDFSTKVGYTAEQLASIPEQANLGLGCGNPTAIAELTEGQTVLDLGSGAGIDCFLASRQVGATGRVIGVDMTASMVARAREASEKNGATNVDFRLGEIEHLPVGDREVDVVISNCVVNLSPDKQAVYNDVFRVLRPGGRVVLSDIVATAEIPKSLRESAVAISGCVGNAEQVATIEQMLQRAGFDRVDVNISEEHATIVDAWFDGASRYVASATITAWKPE